MPNAVARFDEEFDDAPVRRKSAPRKPRAAAAARGKKKARRWFAVDMTRVARWGAIGMSVTVGVGIVANALMWQKGHHPAPLFGQPVATQGQTINAQSKVPLPPPAPVRTASADPAPVAATAQTDPSDATPAAASRPHHAATTSRDTAADGDDPIARLLAGGSAKPAGKAAGKVAGGKSSTERSGAQPDTKTVMGVQKALMKLGFVVKPNGTMGPATKKAIEAFEKDRHLPQKGDMNKRLVKVLSAESGVKID